MYTVGCSVCKSVVTAKASDKRVCELAHAFREELRALQSEESVESSLFLQQVARLHATGHPHRVEYIFEEYLLQAPIPVTEIQLPGVKRVQHVLRIQDVVGTLSACQKLDTILHGHRSKDYVRFWQQYRVFEPRHAIFHEREETQLGQHMPIMLHTDEGSGLKKRGVLILQVHPVLGMGSTRAGELNFKGSTALTRILYTTIPSSTYKGKKGKTVLLDLFQHWAKDLQAMFDVGVRVNIDGCPQQLFMVPIACKGDWPALVQAGQLCRHFGNVAKRGGEQKNGMCHLCAAGLPGFDWHHFGATARWHLNADPVPEPWKQRSPLLCLAMVPEFRERWFKIDLFHTCHKGCFCDLAASATAP